MLSLFVYFFILYVLIHTDPKQERMALRDEPVYVSGDILSAYRNQGVLLSCCVCEFVRHLNSLFYVTDMATLPNELWLFSLLPKFAINDLLSIADAMPGVVGLVAAEVRKRYPEKHVWHLFVDKEHWKLQDYMLEESNTPTRWSNRLYRGELGKSLIDATDNHVDKRSAIQIVAFRNIKRQDVHWRMYDSEALFWLLSTAANVGIKNLHVLISRTANRYLQRSVRVTVLRIGALAKFQDIKMLADVGNCMLHDNPRIRRYANRWQNRRGNRRNE